MNGAVLFNLGLVAVNLVIYAVAGFTLQLVAAGICLFLATIAWEE